MGVWFLLLLFGEVLVAWPQDQCQGACCVVYERGEGGDLNAWIDVPLQKPDKDGVYLELRLRVEDEDSEVERITAAAADFNLQKVRIKVVLLSWNGSLPEVTRISVNEDRVCDYAQAKRQSVTFTWKSILGTWTSLQSKRNRLKRSAYGDIYSNNPFLSNAMNQHIKPVSFHSASAQSSANPYHFLASNPFLNPSIHPSAQTTANPYQFFSNNQFLNPLSAQTTADPYPFFANNRFWNPSAQPTADPHQFFANNPFLNPNKMESADVTFHDTHYAVPERETDMNHLYSNPFLKDILQPGLDVKNEKNNDVGFSQADVHPRRTNPLDVEEDGGDSCGVPVRITPLMARGMKTASGAHPWLGAVYLEKDNGLTLLCGSTLVSKKHVVTAAHCMQLSTRRCRSKEIWVVLGRKNLNQWSYNDGAQIVQAASIHVHPDFKGLGYANFSDVDVAVIRLAEDVTFSPFLLPACLWSGSNRLKDIVGQKGVVAGWGRDESGTLPAEASELKLPVVSEEDCLRSNEAFMMLTSNRTFCAGYRDDSGPCRGDSGSGFLMKVDGKWALRGIVSFALAAEDKRKCNLKEYVVFADVAQHLQWLSSVLGK